MSSEARYNVYVKKARLAYTESTSVKKFTLPPTSIPIAVHCTTAATATNATLNVGISSDDNLYVAAQAVGTAQVTECTLLIGAEVTVPTDIYMNIGGSPASGGPFDVFMLYINKKSRRVV